MDFTQLHIFIREKILVNELRNNEVGPHLKNGVLSQWGQTRTHQSGKNG